jgi:hypothetical protein
MPKFKTKSKPKSKAFKRRYEVNSLVRHEQIAKYERLLKLATVGTHLRAMRYYEKTLNRLKKTDSEIRKKNGLD